MLGFKLAGNMASGAAGRIAAAALGLLSFTVLARALGTEGLGEYRVALTAVAFISMVGDFGLYAVALREISQFPDSQGRILGNALCARLVLTTTPILIAVGLSAATGARRAFVLGLLVAGVGRVAAHATGLLTGVFQEKLRQEYSALAEVVTGAVTLAAVVAVSALAGGPIAMLGAASLGFIVGFLLRARLARRLIPFKLEFDFAYWSRLARAGLPVSLSSVLLLIQLRGDVLGLASVHSASDVGIYDVSVKIYELGTSFAYLFGGLLLPLLSRDLLAGGRRYVERLGGALGVVIAAFTPGVILLVFFGENAAVLIGGEAFRAAVHPIRILGLAMGIGGLAHVLRFATVAGERQAAMLRVDFVAVSIGVLTWTLTIPGRSYVGAAFGKLAADSVMLVGGFLLAGDQRVFVSAARVIPSTLAGGIAMVGVLLALEGTGGSWLLKSAAALVVYAALLVGVPGFRAGIRGLAHETGEGGAGAVVANDAGSSWKVEP